MPVITPNRDAIVAALNGAGLTPVVQAVAAYDATLGLEQLKGARLLVIPGSYSPELITHDRVFERNPSFNVVLQYAAQTPKLSELDPYVALAESIAEYLLGLTLAATGGVVTETGFPDDAFSFDDFEHAMVLTCVVTAKVVLEE